MRILLQSLLLIAVTFAYVAGPCLTAELEHSHVVPQDHGHRHSSDDQGHSHVPKEQDSEPAHEDPQDDDSHTHKHLVSLSAEFPFTPAYYDEFISHHIGAHRPIPFAEFLPDGPSFPLIKPPQLG